MQQLIRISPMANSKRAFWWLIGVAGVSLFFYYAWKSHHSQIGADFFWRITEAKYFAAKINPYYVFVGVVPEVSAYGAKAAAYSFSSYYFMNLLLKITTSPTELLYIYSAIDILSLVGGFYLICKMLPAPSFWPFLFALSTLGSSIFFWQHIYFLNYTLIATFGLILLVYGDYKRNISFIVIGLFVLTLKPAVAIPAFIYLVVCGKVRTLCLCALLCTIILGLTAFRLGESPQDLLRQLSLTQQIFSLEKGYIYSEGIFLPLRFYFGSYFNLFLIGVCFAVFFYLRRLLIDPLQAILIITSVSIIIFYNQTHAWIMAYPLLIYAGAKFRAQKSYMFAVCLLAAFFIIPRFLAVVPEDLRVIYAAVHNIVRFGLLGYLVLFFICSPQTISVSKIRALKDSVE